MNNILEKRKQVGNYKFNKKIFLVIMCIIIASCFLIKKHNKSLKHNRDNTAVNVFSFIT